jgi:glutaredoxin
MEIWLFTKEECKYCKIFKPIWEKLKLTWGDKIKFVTVDCDSKDKHIIDLKNKEKNKGMKTVPRIVVYTPDERILISESCRNEEDITSVIQSYW